MKYTVEQILEAAERAWQKIARPGLCSKDGALLMMTELGISEEEFLERLDGRGLYFSISKVNSNLGQICELLESNLLDGRFISVNSCLKCINCDQFEDSILIGILTVTCKWRKRLPARAELFNKIRQRLFKDGKNADKILEGLGQ